MRPGRLDKILYVGPPDLAGREEILRIRTREMTIGPGVDFQELAVMVCILVELGLMGDL
jgi:AAA family ATPase